MSRREHAPASRSASGELPPITSDIDFDRPGRQVSSLRLVHSDNQNAYGVVPVPIAVFANGAGPTVVLSAGTHGDEYEGQVILGRLIRELDVGSINGRLIVLPALNYPAVLAGERVSPLDDGNLNRSFPGERGGPPTRAIADYVTSVVLPLCDAGIDLHSGGSTAQFLPCAFLCTHRDRTLMSRLLEVVEVFGAPHTFVMEGAPPAGKASSAGAASGFDPVAHQHGVAFFSTELGGGAGVDPGALHVGTAGVYRVLRHLGIVDDERGRRPAASTRYFFSRGLHEYVCTPVTGLFEPCRALGDEVEAGDVAGWVHCLEDPQRPSLALTFPTGGTIMSRRVGARVKRGDFVFHAVEEVDRSALVG